MATNPDFTELGFRVSKLRVSLRIRRGEVRQVLVPEPEILGRAIVSESRELGGTESTREPGELDGSRLVCESRDSVAQSGQFRCRLSSTSSVTSVDSGISSPLARSRTNSSASTSSRTGNILRRIARAALPVGVENAGTEFEYFFNPSTPSMTSSTRSSVSRTPSSSSSTRSSFPSTNPRVRSASSSQDRARISSSSSDYSDLSSTIKELSDPLEEEDTAPPPLPPRKARLRTRALPPYPSTAIRVVDRNPSQALAPYASTALRAFNSIASTMLC